MKDAGMAQEKSIEAALERGAGALKRWTQNGTLIDPQQLVQAWGQDVQTVQAAVQRGDLFEVWVDRMPYFPSALASLNSAEAVMVCHALGGLTASEKLVFLMREHGGLGGQTVAQALKSGTSMGRIEELASANVAGF